MGKDLKKPSFSSLLTQKDQYMSKACFVIASDMYREKSNRRFLGH